MVSSGVFQNPDFEPILDYCNGLNTPTKPTVLWLGPGLSSVHHKPGNPCGSLPIALQSTEEWG